jgi:hypothetical protein
LKSSRGHVRVEQGPPWILWAGALIAGVIGLLVIVLLVRQVAGSSQKDEDKRSGNRTWLEFAWANEPVNGDSVQQLARLLKDNGIDQVYVEAAAWRTDGSLLEGQNAAAFVAALRSAYSDIQVLAWLRMSGEEIKQDQRQSAAVALASKAVGEWKFDGVQLNGRAVANGSESYIQLVRSLRAAIGDKALLSLTVPPDRIPTDPDIPIGPNADAALTWDGNYKQRVALLDVDEIVVMAHASGLQSTADYEKWVAYQVDSYAQALAELDHPADIIVALPTYDAAPEHDPAIEDLRSAAQGVKDGIKQAGRAGRYVKGVGLYEYKTTDSLEWAYFREAWLGLKPQ